MLENALISHIVPFFTLPQSHRRGTPLVARLPCRVLGRRRPCLKLPFINPSRLLHGSRETDLGKPGGNTLKIYILMLLIGTIAAMSHLHPGRNSAKRKA